MPDYGELVRQAQAAADSLRTQPLRARALETFAFLGRQPRALAALQEEQTTRAQDITDALRAPNRTLGADLARMTAGLNRLPWQQGLQISQPVSYPWNQQPPPMTRSPEQELPKGWQYMR